MNNMEGFDLSDYQDGGDKHEEVKNIFGKLLSGRDGYETVLDKNKPIKKCNCGKSLVREEKFCPECGEKVEEEN